MGSILRIGAPAVGTQWPFGAWRRAFSLWRERAEQRRQLAAIALDPRMLRDLGLTPYDAAQEIRKQFWRP